MTNIHPKHLLRRAALALVVSLFASNALADKPSWAGNGKHKEDKEQHGKKGDTRVLSFADDDRRIISDYFGAQARQGKCPPGLAKKNNGCQPPGQAKKWSKGAALKDVKYYELPRELRVRLPLPPVNHRYVQVAGDILMIAIGTSIVVDAIEDILR